jgi:hypothetical protein
MSFFVGPMGMPLLDMKLVMEEKKEEVVPNSFEKNTNGAKAPQSPNPKDFRSKDALLKYLEECV